MAHRFDLNPIKQADSMILANVCSVHLQKFCWTGVGRRNCDHVIVAAFIAPQMKWAKITYEQARKAKELVSSWWGFWIPVRK